MNADKPLGAVALKSFQKTLGSRPQHQGHHAERPERRTDAVRARDEPFLSSFETALKNVTSGRQGVDEALDTAAKRIVQ